jgi:hypothetical protein
MRTRVGRVAEALHLWKREGWDEGITGFGIAVSVLALVFAIVAITLPVAYAVKSRNCAFASQRFHRATHYDFFAGCYIDVGGQSVPLEQYRAFSRAK